MQKGENMGNISSVTDKRGGGAKSGSILDKLKNHPLYKKLKKIKNIEIKLAAIICTLVLIIYIAASLTSNARGSDTNAEVSQASIAAAADELAEILSSIKGAGKIRVLITYDGTGEKIAAETVNTHTNTTVDSGGSSTRTTETVTETRSTVIVQKNGSSEPIILKEILPDIVGIIVVAEGASDMNVRVALLRAVQAATGVKIDKIEIFEMTK
jgi:stage III sporulation protein AG